MTSRFLRDDLKAAPPSRRRWLAAVGYLALGGLSLAVAAVVVLLVAPPLGPGRDRLIQQVEARTGRTLSVAGPLSVSLFPRVAVWVADVTLPPPEGMAGEATVTIPFIEAETSLWSLLTRRPKLEHLTLHRPTVELAVDAQGRRSWDGAPKLRRSAQPEPATPRAAPPTGSSTGPTSQQTTRFRRLRPLTVHIVDGTVRYRDERAGTSYEVSALNLDLTLDSPEAALATSGSFAWEGKPLRFAATAPHEPTAPVVIKVAGAPIEATYEGSLSMHGGIAAEGALSVAHLVYKDVKLGPSRLALSVGSGIAKLALLEAELYSGQGAGTLTVDATGATTTLSAALTLKEIALQPLLRDAGGTSWLDGRGTVTLQLSGQGTSARQIAEALHGQVQLAVADGALTGFDIDKAIRALQRGRLDRLAPRRDDRTPFSALTGTFDIAAGVAKTSDLKLASTHVQLSGEGQIDLAARRIDATLQTRIEGGPPADGAVVNIGTLEVPIGIQGPLDRPEFTIKGQEGLTEAINRIGKNLKSREVKDAIEGLLSGDRSKRVKPAELLEKLLKKE